MRDRIKDGEGWVVELTEGVEMVVVAALNPMVAVVLRQPAVDER
jgi:hypothetical protein